MDQKKEKSKVWLILFFVFLIIMVLAAGMLVKRYINYRTANDQLDSLQSDVNNNTGKTIEEHAEEETPETTEETPEADVENDIVQEGEDTDIINILEEDKDTDTAEEDKDTDIINRVEQSGIKIPDKALDWDALHEENGDIYAWIYVPDTTVDYPVLQHPTDNSYYLNHNMDGTKGYPGCIYTEDFNSKDFSDIHTVIYGHNLKDKTMFSSLHNFENEDLFNKDHYIYIYTEDYVFVYRIFAAYEFDSIHLLDNYDYTNEYVYEDYLRKIYQTTDRVANVREDIQVTTGDKIVTLSTCTADHDSNRRFLVAGVLVNPRG
ncbi:MAG: class B sortase [Lachnospiraceae bacterium]|nr:class B sortase [Lachnospiraceae bacterium]